MSTPYRFTPRVPAPPYPTPASASAYILPNPRTLKPPIRNPYEKFTQPEFDAWIGDITGALRRALGQDEEAPATKKKQDAREENVEEYPRYKQVEAEDSEDEPMDDSFADFKARRAGKGKARDPREGPGLGKGEIAQPIQIVSSDEEEEEEVELSIAQLDDEESEEEEEEEEYSAEEEYAWERGQSSSQPIPSPERTRKRMSVQEEEEYEEEAGEEEEADFEEYDEEYDEEEGEEDLARGSSPQVIELISDDEEEIQSPSISKRPGEERHHGNRQEEELEGEEEYGSDEYAEYDEDQEEGAVLSPKTKESAIRGSDPTSVCRTEREVMDVDEQDEILEDDDEVQPIEPVDVEASLPPKWRRSLDVRQSRVEIPDPWEGPRTYAEDFYAGGDIRPPPGKQMDPSHLGPEDDDIGEHKESVEAEIQPISKDTSFPPETALPASITQQQSDIEVPDPWSGPRHYAQDFYSGGPLTLPPSATANPDKLGPGDSQHVDIVDVQEGVLEEEIDDEIDDEIQPLNEDDSFPPREEFEENLPTIQDPWEGPQVYAEDFYSGGDVRTIPGEPIDSSLLTGTGDLDDGIDAFLTPGALSPSQSERISLVTSEEDVRAPAQHYVTPPSRRDQPIPVDAEFISIDDSDDEQQKEQETKLEDMPSVSEDADYSGIYDFESSLQDMRENVDEDQNIIVPSFGTVNQEETLAVEHGDHFEELNLAEQQIFYVEENEDSLDIHTNVEDQSGVNTDLVDVSLSAFLSEMPPTSHHFVISSPAKELPATAPKQDVVGPEGKIDNTKDGSTTVEREPSQQIIRPAEVIEKEVQGDAASEHVIDLDMQIEGTTTSKNNTTDATLKTILSEGGNNVSIQDQVVVKEVLDISVSPEETVVSVEEVMDTEVKEAEDIPTDDAEARTIKSERIKILVDEVDLEAMESLPSVDLGTEKKELVLDVQDSEGIQDVSIKFIPSSLGVLLQTEPPMEVIPEEILDDLTPFNSAVQPPPEVHFDEGLQETPTNLILSTPTPQSPIHPGVEIEEMLDEDAATGQRMIESTNAAAVNSPNYTVLEAIMDGFTDEDADGEVDQEIEIISVAAASDIQERLVYEEDEYTVEEPVTEGRLTEELSERAPSLGVVSVGPEDAAVVILPEEDITEHLDHISSGEAATEAIHFQDDATVLEEETATAIDREIAAEVSTDTTIQEKVSLQETSKDESAVDAETDHIEEPQGTTDLVATEAMLDTNAEANALEPVSSKLGLPNLSDDLQVSTSDDLSGPERAKELTEGSASVSVPLTPSLVRTIREHTVSPIMPHRQLEPSIGTSSLTSGEMRDQVMSSITRAFFGPTLPKYFDDLNVEFTSAAVPPSDHKDSISPPAPIPATIPESIPETIPDAVPERVPATASATVVSPTVPATVQETVPPTVVATASEATVPPTIPTTVSTITPTTITGNTPATGLETVPTTVPAIIPAALRAILPPAIRATFPITSSSTVPSPLPMGVSLSRPRVPVLMSDPYPYSLSTPQDSLAYLIPEEGSEEETGLDNSLSSISTLEQEKDKKGSVGALDDGEDLEFQYPPEQEVIEELRKAGLPLSFLQPSKVENDTSAVTASVSSVQLDESRLTTPTTKIISRVKREENQPDKPSPVESSIPPSSSQAADNVSTANLPSTSLVESRPKIPTIKIPASSKRSHKRKRDTSPTPGTGQVSHVEPPVGQKGKGKRASKSERKAKIQELKELVAEPTSEETIRVRPPPKGSSKQSTEPEKPTEAAPPAFRLLQHGERASSTVSSTPSDISAGTQQPSPTVNKPNKASQPLPLASLFHAHGKGRKIPVLSFPPKLAKQIQAEKPSVSVTPSTSRVSEQPAAIPASITHVAIATSISDVVQPPSASNKTVVTAPPTSAAPSVATPAPPAPADSSPAPVTPLAKSPAPTVPVANPRTPSVPPTSATVPAAAANTPSQHGTHRARPSRVASMTSSPVTRSHCKYHRISLPKEEGGPRVCFLVPGCSLNDKELMEEEEIEDHGDATVEDSYRMIKDLDSLGFHSDLIGILRQLVGLDILREQEVFYLPAPGEEVFLRKNSLKKSASEKSAMVRVPPEPSSHAGSPGYSGGFAASPSSWKTATPIAGSNSPSITGHRSFIDSEKGSSFAATDTEQDLSDGEEPQTKRSRPSPPEEHRSMGPPPLAVQPKVKPIRIRKPKVPKLEGETVEGAEADKAPRKPRKSPTKRGVKRSRTSEAVHAGEGGEPSPKKLKAHATAPGQLSPEKPPPSS